MGLVTNQNKKGNNKKIIDRGIAITPDSSFSLEDLEKNKTIKQETKTVEAKGNKGPNDKLTSVKISMRTRNLINTLIILGYAESQNEAMLFLLDMFLEGLTPEEKRKFDNQYQVLEDRLLKQ